ncbi:phage antirepressor KilAC domain-containing protein [Bacillus cereus group sp. BfR-BA-00331]|uniref:phage antirepressor KilAC domain-containing protein n=1 Tax=Bacillus cereus group sp. BfR-BA-00331 TaxID=3094866 RepID=UPI0029C32BED|nr:phage antirepressor KilAC domain-containing protein [Bacillus cereus group sp. BfR-BA-00331]MDX5960981.1 phage antirepressor KilAC domain-containing protein [Bacillus cereus group sp. BfR-BA-00331]
MNTLKKFKNEIFEVSAKFENGEVLFDVEQVAKSLGIVDVKNGRKYVRWNRVNSYLPKNSPQVAKGDLVPEPLVYKLAFKASNEIAEAFQDWLAIEVLPSIRKHGAYMTDQVLEQAITNPEFAIGILTKLKEEKEKLAAAQQQIVQQQPLVTFAEACMQSNQTLKVGEVAKLAMKQGVKIGQKRLFDKLRQWGLMFKNSTEPTQKGCERQLFEVAQGVKEKPNGELFTWTTTYVTPKGQAYIIDRLKKEQEQEAI